MTEIVKETVTTQNEVPTIATVTPVKTEASSFQTLEYLIYFFFGSLEMLLGFRLVLKLLGASTTSSFVSFIYALSNMFIMPFEGIFRKMFTSGAETTAVLEPSVFVAIAVYAVIAWGTVRLVRVLSKEQQNA